MRTYLLIALLPWLIFFAFADGTPTGLLFSSVGGLFVLLVFCWRHLRKSFSLAWFTLIFLSIMLIIDFILPQSFLVRYNLFIATSALASFIFTGLVMQHPFTLPYAKIQAPEIFWKHPVFSKVNFWLSAMWGIAFLFYALTALLFYIGIGNKLWMVEILPTAALVFAIGFMIFFPDIYKIKFTRQGMIANIPGISEVQLAKLGKVTLGYRTVGEGPLLILAHGILTNMHSWDPDLIKKLSEKFQVLIFDYPGIGYSTYEDMQFSAATIVECLRALLDKLNLKPLAIVGYSFGGFIAQQFAVKYPQQLSAIVLIGTTCGGKDAVWCGDDVIQKLLRSSQPEISGEERFQQMMSIMFTPEVLPRMIDKMRKIVISAAIEGLVSSEMQEKQRQVVDGFRVNNQLAEKITKLKLPALIVAGKQDVIVPFANAEILANKIPAAKLAVYDDAGHGAPFQYPLDLADKIKEFLAVMRNVS